MKQVQIIMGTPIIIEISNSEASQKLFDEAFDYFKYVDEKFSTYKNTSEIMKINRNEIKKEEWSHDMQEIFRLADEAKEKSNGYFDIMTPEGIYDPSGIVKGWAIQNASNILKSHGVKNFYVEAGGDIQAYGKNDENTPWFIGIQNPFNEKREVVKAVYLSDKGIATSGTYVRGQHIYNPHKKGEKIEDIVSLSVIGPNILEADKIATSAFAMGKNGIYFVEDLKGYEGYMIDKNGIATMTTSFNNYTKI